MRGNKVLKQCEQSSIITQYNELKEALLNQQKSWMALNKTLLQELAIN
jgi:hypothetical protein